MCAIDAGVKERFWTLRGLGTWTGQWLGAPDEYSKETRRRKEKKRWCRNRRLVLDEQTFRATVFPTVPVSRPRLRLPSN